MNVHVQDRGGRTTGGRDSFSDLRDDFGAPIRAGRRYSSVGALGRPWKEPGTARPVPWSSVEWILPTTSGGRADRARELAPRPQPRETRRQMQDDPAHRALYPHGEFDQSLPQGGDLGVRADRPARTALEFLEQDVRRQRQEDPELVAEKSGATGAVHLQPVIDR